jgi:hypothetical protein
MREHSQSVFLVEGLQPSWLGARAERVAYGTVVALSLGLIFALIWGLSIGVLGDPRAGLGVGLSLGLGVFVVVGSGCWSESPLRIGVISGSISGLFFGLVAVDSEGLVNGLFVGLFVGSLFGLMAALITAARWEETAVLLNRITLVESISWKWNQFWKGTLLGLFSGLSVGLILGLIVGASESLGLIGALILGLVGALVLGLVGALVSGLVGGFTVRVKVGRASPNQGIKLSRKNSVIVFLVTFLAAGLIGGRPSGLIGGLRVGQRVGLRVGLSFGLIVGLIVGLNRGGSAVIKHYALRLSLWLKGYTPFRFVRFLDQCAS